MISAMPSGISCSKNGLALSPVVILVHLFHIIQQKQTVLYKFYWFGVAFYIMTLSSVYKYYNNFVDLRSCAK
jgi:hypothetical protein